MRYWLLLVATGALAQQLQRVYTTDLNGRRVEAAEFAVSKTASGVQRTERSRSINGRTVPLEQIEERVLREDASGRVVERWVRKFDADGKPGLTERAVIEEQRRPDGGSVRRETVYRSDVNGALQPAERSVTESRKQDTTVVSETLIERPSLSGAFEPAEKRSLTAEESGDKKHENLVVYRRAQDGGFHEAIREITDQHKEGGAVIENKAYYEPGVTGQLQLHSQQVKKSANRPDGTEVIEVNLYSNAVPGRVNEAGAGQQLKEQQIIERRPEGNDTVLEIFSVRRPSVSDPTRLGELRKLSETVCKGKCDGGVGARP